MVVCVNILDEKTKHIPRSVLDVDEILDEVVTDREVTDVDLQTAPVIDILQMIRSNPFMEIDVINEGEESDLDQKLA